MKELEKAKTDLNDDEVERAKNKIASSLVLSRRSPPRPDAQRSAGSGSTTSEYRSLETDMATLMAVNRDSLEQLMRDFPFDPMTIVSLGPGDKSAPK